MTTSSHHPRYAIVMAAGKGTRLKSDLPKVLQPLLGKPLLQRVLESLAVVHNTQPFDDVYVIVGHQAELVTKAISNWDLPFSPKSVLQAEQLGTGHAIQQVVSVLPETTNATVLITSGDMPLVPADVYAALLNDHPDDMALTVLTVDSSNPTGYGRLVFDDAEHHLKAIVEEKDASEAIRQIPWINAGIYAANWPMLCQQLGQLKPNNKQQEFYLTDVVGLLVKQGQVVNVHIADSDEYAIRGVNNRMDLFTVSSHLSFEQIYTLAEAGVSFIGNSTISPEVAIAADSTILPNCTLIGDITIGSGCTIGPNTTLLGPVTIGHNTTVQHCVLENNVSIGDNCTIGPFTHLRDNSEVGDNCRLGNFVEVKQTRIANGTNAAHLCYLGDATIGSDVNMGAGSIIANYDPVRDVKHQTTINSGAKIGCNSTLIAPVTIGENACVAAGSTITQNVEAEALAIARNPQQSKPGWVSKQKTLTH